jgi:hypothetical protein
MQFSAAKMNSFVLTRERRMRHEKSQNSLAFGVGFRLVLVLFLFFRGGELLWIAPNLAELFKTHQSALRSKVLDYWSFRFDTMLLAFLGSSSSSSFHLMLPPSIFLAACM